jgi:hypothetical protein
VADEVMGQISWGMNYLPIELKQKGFCKVGILFLPTWKEKILSFGNMELHFKVTQPIKGYNELLVDFTWNATIESLLT